MLINLLFDFFSIILIASSLCVILARNPVHSVLFLILAFFNASVLFLLAGAEYLAMMLLVVYVGAVIVLFLFVVMMLNIDFSTIRAKFSSYSPIAIIIALVMLIELIFSFTTYNFYQNKIKILSFVDKVSNIELIGKVLYTDYAFYFELSGLLLFAAMIASIILTLQHKNNFKRQSIPEQVSRTKETSIEIKKVKFGQGIGE